jgi:hypothetical protein
MIFFSLLQLKILMMRTTNLRAPCDVRVAGIFNSISIACAWKTSYLRAIFPDLRVYDIVNFCSHISATKIMFWALARVRFRAAKIVSCNRNFFFMVYDQNYHNYSTLDTRYLKENASVSVGSFLK